MCQLLTWFLNYFSKTQEIIRNEKLTASFRRKPESSVFPARLASELARVAGRSKRSAIWMPDQVR
ncbi:MAG: hypothetical protein KAU41_02340, partial [Deltaproteobacteria bacterium]|nr:hypothetical protein [Deltaproteobacteria bacterium]